MPPALGVDAWLGYEGEWIAGRLGEGTEPVGRFTRSRQDIRIGAEFAPIDGLSGWLELETTADRRLVYPDAPQMLYDPVTGSGTYLGADRTGETASVEGSGLVGLWIGAGLAPLHERFAPGARAAYRLDVAMRTPNRRDTFWSATQGGSRGAAPGGWGWLLSAAFSAEHEAVDPYLAVRYQAESRLQLDVVDEAGSTWIEGAILKPANALDVCAGVEVIARRVEARGVRTAVDLYTGFGYRSWQDVPSGLYLPEVLDASRSLVVTMGEHALLRGGVGLDARFSEQAQLRLSAELRWLTPHRLESPYEVRTLADTLGAGLLLTFRGGFRPARPSGEAGGPTIRGGAAASATGG